MHLNCNAATFNYIIALGFIDDIIEPSTTHRHIREDLKLLHNKHQHTHTGGNTVTFLPSGPLQIFQYSFKFISQCHTYPHRSPDVYFL